MKRGARRSTIEPSGKTTSAARSGSRAFAPANRLARAALDHASRLGPAVPRPRHQYAARFREPWHIRTMIVPMPGASGVELFFTNLFVGRVGVAGFDDEPPRERHERARDEGHLVVLALGPGARVTESLAFSRRDHLRATRGGFRIEVPGDFELEVVGRWPEFHQRLSVPGERLEAELRIDCQSPVRWWAHAPRTYLHHSAFGHASGSVVVRGARTSIEHLASLEPAAGNNMLRFPMAPLLPATLFHYQLGTLPGVGSFALGCFRAGAFEPFRTGEVVFADGGHARLNDWEMSVAETSWVTARAGAAIEVPSRWTVRARGERVRLSYAAERRWPAFAGTGRLTSSGAHITGRLERQGQDAIDVAGIIYEEHLAAPGVAATP